MFGARKSSSGQRGSLGVAEGIGKTFRSTLGEYSEENDSEENGCEAAFEVAGIREW